jgi:hypothetical protein
MFYSNVDKALCNQLQATASEVYISAILDPIIGIGNTTCLTLLTHLHDIYGTVVEAELGKILDRMKIQWNPPTSIKIVFTQINDGVDFATAGGDTPTGPSIICITYKIVAVTGRFEVATHKWWAKTAVNKTWEVFQNHVKVMDSDNRLTVTSGTVGYRGAANLSTTVANTQAALVSSKLAIVLAL